MTLVLLAHGVPLERARELSQDVWLRLMKQEAMSNFDVVLDPLHQKRRVLLRGVML